MPDAKVNYEAPDLAARIERLSQYELDHLPFGVVRLDFDGSVRFYSATEARLSAYGAVKVGDNFFAVSQCVGKDDFQERIKQAHESGPVDLEFAFPGDHGDPNRGLRIRVQSARQGGVWIFVERD